MTILDINGNTLKTGKPACNWFSKHKGDLVEYYVDGAGRSVATFNNGHCAMFFAEDEHPKLLLNVKINTKE